MSKTTFFLLIVAIVLIAVGIFFYFLYFTDIFEGRGAISQGARTVRNFLPFGDLGTQTIPGDGSGGDGEPILKQPGTGIDEPLPRLMKLVPNPVAGFTSYVSASSTIVRYMERASGRVFDIDMSIPSARTRITNTTIPRVQEAFFANSGETVLLRYVDADGIIQTYSANVPKATTSDAFKNGVELRGVFLPENMADVALAPESSRYFGLISYGGSAIGTISDLNGSKKAQVFDSAFTEWLPSWTNEKNMLMVTKPSYATPGYAYLLDVKLEIFQKLYGGNMSGLTALLSPDAKNLLVSEDNMTLKIYRLTDKSLNETGLRTITDKCRWLSASIALCGVPKTQSPGSFPDAWYQGLVSFSDDLWRIDAETSEISKIWSFASGKEDIDIVNMAADKNKQYVFFQNKKDSSLWALRLEGDIEEAQAGPYESH